MDELHALVKKCYEEMSSRVQALEVLHIQKDDECSMSEDDAESLATMHAHHPDLSSEETIESGLGHFDFLNELQSSLTYKRDQAFRGPVISALTNNVSGLEHFDFLDELRNSRVYRRSMDSCRSEISVLTNSVYSLGWSLLSDLSIAEVSNISVINLAITKGEVVNPRRSSQTWSAQPSRGVSIDDHLDRQRTQPYKVARESDQAISSAFAREHQLASIQTQQRSLPQNRSPSPKTHPFERSYTCHGWEKYFKENETTRNAENLNPTATPLPAESLDPLSPSQTQAPFLPRPDEWIDEEAYQRKGCAEVCLTPQWCLSVKPSLHGSKC